MLCRSSLFFRDDQKLANAKFSDMKEGITTVCVEIEHGTKEYEQTVSMRDEVLRKPLGLQFSPGELTDEKSSFHLACLRDGILVACLVLKPLPGKQIRMRQLAVRSGSRGQGLGRTLVSYSESFARDQGHEEMVLHARETAVGFYEKAGYTVSGDRFVEVTIPHFSMRKSLLNNEHSHLDRIKSGPQHRHLLPSKPITEVDFANTDVRHKGDS